MKRLLTIGALGLLLTACGTDESNGENASASEHEMQELKVEVVTEPKGDVGEWTLEAYVSQGGEAVNDATEVKFEIFEAGKKDESVQKDYAELKDGVYSVEHVFDEAGVYYFISHVTARSMHTMPTQQVIVGDVTDEEIAEAEKAMEHSSEMDEHDDMH